MLLYIARDEIYNQLFLHTEQPVFKNKVYISRNGVCFDPPQYLKDKYENLKPSDGVVELTFKLIE